jgi:succinylarginine dihydrolase
VTCREYNFDGLVGPTHNYAGLALGNIASAASKGSPSDPRAAALEGLAKIRACLELGLAQGILPPHDRPHLRTLRAHGFSGRDEQIIEKAARRAPDLLANSYSASAMWAANAATVAPSSDTEDGKVHFTPANLASNFHRAMEAETTARILSHIFPHPEFFVHHPPLPPELGDEGAANHGRLAHEHGAPGVHLFIYGEDGDKFPARQNRPASEAVARNHTLDPAKSLFLQQSKAALDAGAFHFDVMGVANERVLFLHEQSLADPKSAYGAIRAAAPFIEIIEAPAKKVSLDEAVKSYLFNSQLITLPGGDMALLLPTEAEEYPRMRAFLDDTLAKDNSIKRLIFMNVRQSMRNGGGPACLRLRVALSEREAAAARGPFILDETKVSELENWVRKHYRDRLSPGDLRDPALMRESFAALDALTQILEMGAFYDCQR